MLVSTRSSTAWHKLGLRAGFLTASGILAVAVMAGPMGLLQSGQDRAATVVAPPATTSPAPPVTSTTVALTVPTIERPRVAATTKTTTKATTPATVPSKPRPAPVHTASKVSAPHRIVVAAPTHAPSPAPAPAPVPAPAPAPAPVPAPHTYRATSNPPASVAPSAQMQSDCGSSRLAACNSDSLAAINKARAAEGLGALQLPSNFYSLSNNSQVLAVINAERTSRGLPAYSYNPAYQSSAQNGANTGSDPSGPAGTEWSAILASGYPTALAADYVWMYDDGLNSPNGDCTTAGSSGCWGHRNAILSPWAGGAAVGWATVNGTTNVTALFVAN